MIELPVNDNQPMDPQEIVDQDANEVQPLDLKEIVEQPIVVVGQPGNQSPPIHPLENLPGYIAKIMQREIRSTRSETTVQNKKSYNISWA